MQCQSKKQSQEGRNAQSQRRKLRTDQARKCATCRVDDKCNTKERPEPTDANSAQPREIRQVWESGQSCHNRYRGRPTVQPSTPGTNQRTAQPRPQFSSRKAQFAAAMVRTL